MTQTLIDTLRFANPLKAAGFIGPPAEALARTLGDGLTEQLPSNADFQELRANFETQEAQIGALDAPEPGPNRAIKSLAAKIDGSGYQLNALLVLNGSSLMLVSVTPAAGMVEPVSKLFRS